MLDDIIIAFPVAFFLSIMIGPVFFVLIETSITKGIRAALSFNSGVLFGDVVFILIAYLGSYQLIQNVKDDPLLFISGGFIMSIYGLVSYVNLRKSKGDVVSQKDVVKLNKKNYLGLFIKGFLLNFINIGVLGFWLGVIITVTPRLDLNPYRIVIFFTSVISFYFLIDLIKIYTSKRLSTFLTPINIYKIKKVTSILLIVFGLFLVLQGIFPGGKNQFLDFLSQIEV